MGREYGPDNNGVNGTGRVSGKGWIYLAIEDRAWDPKRDAKRFYVSEEELVRWNQ